MRLPRLRFPRVRLTVRRLLVVVAISAVAMMAVQSNHYRREAENHSVLEERCQDMLDHTIVINTEYDEKSERKLRQSEAGFSDRNTLIRTLYAKSYPLDQVDRLMVEHLAEAEHFVKARRDRRKSVQDRHARDLANDLEWVAWNRALKEKYRRAMWFPWLPVAPGPPHPVLAPEPPPPDATQDPEEPDSPEPE